jgi:hypothetical protein
VEKKMNIKHVIAVFAVLLAVALSTLSIGGVAANPISMPYVLVNSPQNNQIYPSNTIQLTFTQSTYYDFINFSSYSYSLDGQPAINTDGNTVLTNLAPGSHILTIYGNSTTQYSPSQINDRVLEKVYFSVAYSTMSVTFVSILSLILVPFLLALFLNRHRLVGRFKAKKTGGFWAGAVCLIVALIAFVPSAWCFADVYLFPNFHRGMIILPFMPLIFGALFIPVGVGMMVYGTRQNKLIDKT